MLPFVNYNFWECLFSFKKNSQRFTFTSDVFFLTLVASLTSTTSYCRALSVRMALDC